MESGSVFCSLRAAFPLDKLTPQLRDRYQKDPSWFGDIYLMNADGSNVRRLTNEPGYDGGPLLFARWPAHRLATFRGERSDRRHLDDEDRWHGQTAHHGFQIDVVGTVFSSERQIHHFYLEQIRLRELRALHGRHSRRARASAGHLHQRFRRAACVFARRQKALLDKRANERWQSAAFLADWNDETAQEAIAQSPLRGSEGKQAASLSPAISKTDLEHEVQWLADAKRDGRMTGTPGARAAGNWLADYFQKIGLKSFGKDYGWPFEFTSGERVLPDKSRCEIAIDESRPSTRLLNTISGRSLLAKMEAPRARSCLQATAWWSPKETAARPTIPTTAST